MSSNSITAAMLVYKTKSKKVFWEFDSIIMQNSSDTLPSLCAPTWPSHHVCENQEYTPLLVVLMYTYSRIRNFSTGTKVFWFRFWIIPQLPAPIRLEKGNRGTGKEIDFEPDIVSIHFLLFILRKYAIICTKSQTIMRKCVHLRQLALSCARWTLHKDICVNIQLSIQISSKQL